MYQKTRRPKDGEYQDVSEIDEYEYEFLHFSWLFYVQRITKLGKSIDKNCISVIFFVYTTPKKLYYHQKMRLRQQFLRLYIKRNAKFSYCVPAF